MENKKKLELFQNIFLKLNLNHHPYKRMKKYLDWCFKGVNFKNKEVLDIGGGNGIYSYYSMSRGANYALNLEPFESGSTFYSSNLDIDNPLKIETINNTIQNFSSTKKFDIIILHDSINHLNEPLFEHLHQNQNSYSSYVKLINKICSHLKETGIIIITDCSRYNFWGSFGIKNPFAPSIEWNLHQSPYLVLSLFKGNFIKYKLRWSPFKRFGQFGYFLSKFGKIPSYFLQSHYNIIIKFQKK